MSLVCAAPVNNGPLKGAPATGTVAGYQRHRRAKETACDECLEAMRIQSALQHGNTPKAYGRKWNSHGHLPAVSVKCANCGSRGRANPVVVGRKRIVESCVECRVTV